MDVKFRRVPEDLRLLTKLAIKFYEDQFMPTKHEKFDLIVVFDSTFCQLGSTTQPDPEMFVITVAEPIHIVGDYLNTLFHELTHVKQLIEGRLHLGHKTVVFEGNPIDVQRWGSSSCFEALTAPWEIEAYGMGEIATLCFIQEMRVIDTNIANALLERGTENLVRQETEWGRIEGSKRLKQLQTLRA